MDEKTRRENATREAMRKIHEATIKHSKDPQRVSEAKRLLADLDK